MGKFSKKSTPTRTINKAGGFAYKMNVETELVHAVLTTFLDDKYYEDGDERTNRIIDLVSKNKPQFVSNLAIIARDEFNLRSVATLLIGELSKVHRGDSLVKDTIIKAAMRVDDLTELVAYIGTPIPKQVKRGIRNALLKFSPYQLAKYKGEGNDVSLVDMFNLVHPKVQHATKEQKKAWKDLMTGKLKSFDTWESELSASKPVERKKIWTNLIKENKLGYMALLRNLNNMIKEGVSEKTLDIVVAKLTDPRAVKESKQLPFRFVTAYDNVQGNRKLTTAISDAMDIAVDNTPEFTGKTLIAIDGSGSMNGKPIQIASIFGATLAKSHCNADVVIYDEQIQELKINGRIPTIDLAKKIESGAHGGGTNTSLVFQYAIQSGKKYTRIIIVSDNESWQDSSGTQTKYNEYRKISDPVVFAIDIQGYGTKDIDSPKVKHLCGWSDRVLDFISHYEKGDALITYIKNYA